MPTSSLTTSSQTNSFSATHVLTLSTTGSRCFEGQMDTSLADIRPAFSLCPSCPFLSFHHRGAVAKEHQRNVLFLSILTFMISIHQSVPAPAHPYILVSRIGSALSHPVLDSRQVRFFLLIPYPCLQSWPSDPSRRRTPIASAGKSNANPSNLIVSAVPVRPQNCGSVQTSVNRRPVQLQSTAPPLTMEAPRLCQRSS